MAEQNMLNRNIDNGDKLRKSALLIGQDVMTAAHVDRHFEDGSINGAKINLGGINVEDLGTAATNTSYALKPDGAGGLVFGAVGGGGGAIDYDGTFTTSLKSTNATVGALTSIAIGNSASTGAYYQSVAIGYYASQVASGVSIGAFSADYGGGGTTVGRSAKTYSQSAVAIGSSSGTLVGADGGIAVGVGSSVSGLGGIAIGYNASSSGARGVAIGNGVANTTADSLKVGWGNSNGQNIQFTSFVPSARTPTATHTIPVAMNGSTFHILLTNVAP